MTTNREMVFFDIDYVTTDEKAVVRLFGREKIKEGYRNLVAIDNSFEPYLYILPYEGNIGECEDDVRYLLNSEMEKPSFKIERVNKKDLSIPKDFLKLTLKHPQMVPKHRDAIRELESVKEIREHDIPFYRRYLIDNNIFPMSKLQISGNIVKSSPSVTIRSDLAKSRNIPIEKNENGGKTLEIMEITETPKTIDDGFPDFKIMSFDLEVRNPHGMPDSERDEIIMIGISGNFGVEKVLSTKGGHLDFVEELTSEKEMIKRFVEIIKENNIDIIVGYNSDNFDFPYIKDRAKILGVKMDLGLDGSEISFKKRGYANAAGVKGINHIDLYLVMRRYMSLDRYTLERVYLELFGEEKIDVPGDKIWEYWDAGGEKLDELFRYSLDDVIATYKIGEITLPLNLELTRIVGQPFFDITRMATGQQVEWYLVRKAFEYGEVSPNKPTNIQYSSRKGDRATGGYVKEPEKGLHENLVQFDFRSLYPSIIISKNVSPDALVKKTDISSTLTENNVISNTNGENNKTQENNEFNIAPEYGHKFVKDPQGFIPSVIGNVLAERTKIKEAMNKCEDPAEKKSLSVQQDALKRLANTMYGVYGYSRFRWYSFECAESITAWGRDFIKATIESAEEYGFHTIYADTDGFYAKYVGLDK
ncbi:MAG: DNA polymerase domain-containing protein [Methanobacteriaceae archaeon]